MNTLIPYLVISDLIPLVRYLRLAFVAVYKARVGRGHSVQLLQLYLRSPQKHGLCGAAYIHSVLDSHVIGTTLYVSAKFFFSANWVIDNVNMVIQGPRYIRSNI